MADVLSELVAFLAAEGLGTAGTDLFFGRMPDTPDACGCVYATGGLAPDQGFGSAAVRFESPGIQIVFRGAALDYDTPNANARTAWTSLAGVNPQTALTGTTYHWVHATQSQPFLLGEPDEKQRFRIVCNYIVEKEMTA